MEHKIDPEILRDLFGYNAETGALTWLRRNESLFASSAQCRRWNTRYAGRPALTYVNPKGYMFGSVNGIYVLAHRVAWAWANGEWPKGQIDHENGMKSDNRLTNLRVVCNARNAQNRPLRTDNKTGFHGVRQSDSGKRWVAVIGRSYIGTFDDFETAINARKKAEHELGYHVNHGRLAVYAGAE